MARQGLEQRARVRMVRTGEQVIGAPRLDDPPCVEHGDPIAEVADEVEVVADEEDAEPVLALQRSQEPQDLLGERDVERSRRFVGDQQARAAEDRHGDHRALEHSARELMGIEAHRPFRVRQLDLAECLDDELRARLAVDAEVSPRHLLQLRPDREHGVEARRRALEDHRHLAPAHAAQLRLRERQHVSAVELDPAGCTRVARQHPDDRQARERLATPGLADDADGLSMRQFEVDAAERLRSDLAVAHEVDREIVDRQQVANVALRGSRMSRSASPSRFRPSATAKMARPGNVAVHHSVITVVRPSATMRPQSGVGGCAPRPRNDSERADREDHRSAVDGRLTEDARHRRHEPRPATHSTILLGEPAGIPGGSLRQSNTRSPGPVQPYNHASKA
jgi:hypothetical protein